MTPEQFVTVSRTQVREFFRKWEQDHRDGNCIPYGDQLIKEVEQIADENAEMFWGEMHPYHTSANVPNPEDGSPR